MAGRWPEEINNKNAKTKLFFETETARNSRWGQVEKFTLRRKEAAGEIEEAEDVKKKFGNVLGTKKKDSAERKEAAS